MLKLFVVCTALAMVLAPLAHGQEGQGGPVKTVKVPSRGELRDTEVIKAWVAQCQKKPTSCDRDEYQVREFGGERFELFADDPKSYARMKDFSSSITLVVRQD